MFRASFAKFLAIAALVASLSMGCAVKLPLTPPTATSPHLLLGNPSQAKTDISQPDNYLIIKPQYVLSYNNTRHTPNWVSWQLNNSWLGNVPRSNDFRPDDSLPTGWYRVTPADYTGSGYDRGHMTPAADRSANGADNSATFLMTNMVPQTGDNNRGPWERFESYCRDLVRQGKELYIVAGVYGQQQKIGRGKEQIIAPTHTWKVVVVLDQPGQGLKGITAQTRTIAISIPNAQGIMNTDWRKYRVSIQQIETATGYDLLSSVSPNIQTAIAPKVDRL